MRWVPFVLAVAAAMLAGAQTPAEAVEIAGEYLEMRTCDIYTGPCFANAQVGLTGREAILAWHVEEGSHLGVDLAGLHVVAVVRASDTLGYGGGLVVHPEPIESVVLIDSRATAEQQEALLHLIREKAGRVLGQIRRVDVVPIEMRLDHVTMEATLKAGDAVRMTTRKLGQQDCVCTNEVVFYPPLVETLDYEPAYTLEGRFTGRGLGVKFSSPETRSAFLATFAY